MLKLKARAVRAGALAAVALATFPAMASAAKCDKVQTSKVFAALGDTSDYFLAPGGDFEGKLTWKVSGPVVQAWTHPALPTAGSTGLVLSAGGSVTSPNVCADMDRPTLRLFAFAPRGSGTLRVDAVSGKDTVTLGRLDGSRFSLAAGLLNFGSLLGLGLDTSKDVQVRLTAESGTWIADAVYVDPYMR
jgi:hypothetical protein